MTRTAWIPAAAGAALLIAMTSSAAAAVNTAPGLLKLSARGNIAEVELGQLAITRSTNPAIQNLGTRLAQDGSKGVANLQAVASMLHVQLPVAPNATQEGQLAKLGKLQGAAFDKRFKHVVKKDESKMLHQFQSGVSAVHNGAVKATVKDMIPIVKEHLAIVRGM